MMADQKNRPIPCVVIRLEGAEYFFRLFCAFRAVAVEMSDPVRPDGKAVRFSDIVQQRRKAKMRFRRNVRCCSGGMRKQIKTVVRIFLIEPLHRRDFRDQDGEDVGITEKHPFHSAAAEKLSQFRVDALP